MPTASRRSTMPAIILTRTPSPPSPKLGVVFADNLVQSVSRPINESESRALNRFEYHAGGCHACCNPSNAYKSGHPLCEIGHQLAQNVAAYLYDKEGEVYSAREGSKTVRVEIPTGYDKVRQLLKAIERSLRHRSRAPFVSMDRSYRIATREPSGVKPSRKSSIKISQPKAKSRRDSIVEWPEEEMPRSILVTKTPTASGRGSLYEADLAQQRRDYAKYNVELREPTNRISGYHR